jgi:PhnB protein
MSSRIGFSFRQQKKENLMVKKIPEGYSAVTPYLVVTNTAKALEFYKKAFNAQERMRLDLPAEKFGPGRIGHAEITIGGAVVMLCDEIPGCHARSPEGFGGTPVTIHIYVEDVDAVMKRAQEAGALVVTPAEDKPYGDRTGTLRDPFGHEWYVATHIEDVSLEEVRRRIAAMPSAA